MSRINDIIDNFKAGKITREEANAQLKAEGAGFTLDPEQNPGGGWTQEELEQAIQEALAEQEKGLGYVVDCNIEETELVRPMVNGGTHITEFLVN